MDKLVYGLCMLTSIVSAVLLARGYRHSRMRLLYWSAICFSFLAVANVIVYVDLILLPVTIDLLVYRNVLTFLGLGVLVYGMIQETV